MRVLEFYVPGIPRPQGSHEPGERHLRPSSRYLKEWRDSIIVIARGAMRGQWRRLEGPVFSTLIFYMPRPRKSLYPIDPYYATSAPDGDKQERAVNDALTAAGVWRDDRQVAFCSRLRLWADAPHVRGLYPREEGVYVRIEPLVRGMRTRVSINGVREDAEGGSYEAAGSAAESLDFPGSMPELRS